MNFTRVKVPVRMTYSLETDDSLIKEITSNITLDVDLQVIAMQAKEEGLSRERVILQWITRNIAHTAHVIRDQEKAALHNLALKHNISLKIGVSLNGAIKYEDKIH